MSNQLFVSLDLAPFEAAEKFHSISGYDMSGYEHNLFLHKR